MQNDVLVISTNSVHIGLITVHPKRETVKSILIILNFYLYIDSFAIFVLIVADGVVNDSYFNFLKNLHS